MGKVHCQQITAAYSMGNESFSTGSFLYDQNGFFGVMVNAHSNGFV